MNTSPGYSSVKSGKRIWHAPRSRSALFWFWFCLFCCGTLYLLNIIRKNVPWYDPLYYAGIGAYLMVLLGSTYSLRTRFMRNLPGKAQSWLWMHTWVGISALLLAGLHENFRFVLYGYCFAMICLTGYNLGLLALYSLLFIVASGVVGRLLDQWQARIIVQDANANGIGTAGAIKSRTLELEYAIERLYAGKSDAFQQYYTRAMRSTAEPMQGPPPVMMHEQGDSQKAYALLCDYTRLKRSLAKQEFARLIFLTWRRVHMVLVPLALLLITLHSFSELITLIFHVPIYFLP